MDALYFAGGFLQPALTTTLLLLLTFFVLIRVKQAPRYRKLMAFPHESETIPLVRHLVLHSTILWKAYRTGMAYNVIFVRIILNKLERYRRHGCFALFVGADAHLVVFRADHIEKVLTNTVNIRKGRIYTFIEPWLGTGLLTSTGSKWKQRRKMLTPAFHFRILDKFTDVMNRQAQIFVDSLARKGDEEDIVPRITALTLDIVCETIMGVQPNCQTTGAGAEYMKSLKSVGEKIIERIQSPSQWFEPVYKLSHSFREYTRNLEDLHKFTVDVINERKAELERDPERLEAMAASEEGLLSARKPFLDLLLVEHLKRNTMTLSDIREEVDTFMFGGHDTTSMGLTWAIYLLGRHPEVQKKIQDEIDEVFGADAGDADVSAEHVKQMKYLDMALKETQRICPSVPIISRLVDKEFELYGKPVPVGTELTCQILGLHRDPEVFPDPLKFDPDRFLPENSVGRSPFAFIPFSAGPRNCIGQKFALLEEKIIIVWLLRKFSLESLDSFEEIQMAAEMVLLPKNPIRVKCVPRAN